MLKCIQCTIQRQKLIQNTAVRMLKTTTQKLDDKPQEKAEKPQENEAANTMLKVQMPSSISEDYKTIFKFPAIRYFALVNRMKIYQTAFTAVSTPGALILNQLNLISTEKFQIVAVVGISICATLYAIGYFTGNFIGFIYYNEKINTIRISYADQWGRRKDLEVPVNDIVHFDNKAAGPFGDLWYKFRRNSTKHTLKIINQKHAIVDTETFQKLM